MEKDFSKKIIKFLNKKGFDVTRIESHNTANGIPDMFVQGHGTDFWLELKSVKREWKEGDKPIIQYRPGQKAWHILYARHHHYCKHVHTLVEYEHHIIIAKVDEHKVIHKDNFFHFNVCEIIGLLS